MKKTYTLEVIVRGFEYFAKSRSFCKLLRNLKTTNKVRNFASFKET